MAEIDQGPVSHPKSCRKTFKPFITVLCAFIPEVFFTSLPLNTDHLIYIFFVYNNSNTKCDNSICMRVTVWRRQFFLWLAAKETDKRGIRRVRWLSHHRDVYFYTENAVVAFDCVWWTAKETGHASLIFLSINMPFIDCCHVTRWPLNRGDLK